MIAEFVLGTDERSGVARRFETIRNDQCDGLPIEQDSIGVQGTERMTRRSDLVAPFSVQPCCAPHVFMGEDADNARKRCSTLGIQRLDAPDRDCCRNDHPVQEIRGWIFRGIARAPRDFQLTIDTACGFAEQIVVGSVQFH
ncbi:hypothetical protein ABID62_008502 [Bradyrhizobium sp. S3.9.1]